MVPSPDLLADVLPTERLTVSGMPVPEVRRELRRIDNLRNVGSVVLCWAQAAITIGLCTWIGHPLAYLAGIVLMGPVFARFLILGHEAAHKLLFTNKRANDFVGKWLLDAPGLVPFGIYRRSHFAHHKEEFGPTEPDIAFYRGYPMPASSLWRKLRRDALFSSGWKNLTPLFRALKSATGRRLAMPIYVTQAVIFAVFWAIGHPWLYLVLWIVPWMTSWRVINRLRAIAEHGGMEASKDRRKTTHHVRQSRLASFWVVPFNTGWHLAHHVDMGVPWRNLPALHRELVDAGWVVPELEYPNYRALWKALASGAEVDAGIAGKRATASGEGTAGSHPD